MAGAAMRGGGDIAPAPPLAPAAAVSIAREAMRCPLLTALLTKGQKGGSEVAPALRFSQL